MKSLVKLIAIMLIVPIAFIVCSPVFASNSNNRLDPFIAELIQEQLTEEELAALSDTDKYDQNLLGKQIMGYPILKVYTEVFWEKADLSLDELVSFADRYSNDLGFSDYVVFAENPFRIRMLNNGADIHIGKVDEGWNNIPTYVSDLMTTSNKIVFQNNEYRIKGIRCFDALSSQQGAVVYFDTDKGALVKYYENSYSESIIYSEKDFSEKATAYYEYITSQQHNYNDDGEPLGGSMISFAAFLKNEKTASSDSVRKRGNVKSVLISCCVIVILLAVCILLICRKRNPLTR